MTWSTWLSTLLSVKDPSSAETSTKDETKAQAERAESPGTLKTFNLLKATGELLMLPKDMILDMAMRREVSVLNFTHSTMRSSSASPFLTKFQKHCY